MAGSMGLRLTSTPAGPPGLRTTLGDWRTKSTAEVNISEGSAGVYKGGPVAGSMGPRPTSTPAGPPGLRTNQGEHSDRLKAADKLEEEQRTIPVNQEPVTKLPTELSTSRRLSDNEIASGSPYRRCLEPPTNIRAPTHLQEGREKAGGRETKRGRKRSRSDQEIEQPADVRRPECYKDPDRE